MYILLVFILVVAVVVGAVLIHMMRLRAEARRCAVEARQFQTRLRILTAPNHLFTDEELVQLKKDINPLLARVNRLYKNYFISSEYLDDLGLGDFIEARMHLNHSQFVNNSAHQG